MAVKRCPDCGDLFLAAVDACADCGTRLVEVDESAPAATGSTTGTGGEVTSSITGEHATWELDAWTMEGRRLLDGMLGSAEIPRVWQGATLVVPSSVGDRVGEMVEVVARGDARVGVDDRTLAATDAEADDGETVGYEVADWSSDALDRLEDLLAARAVPYGWDEDGDLVVAATHEPTVDAVFDQLTGDGTDDGDPDDEGGPEALEALSSMFFAADTLARNPGDGNAAHTLADARARVASQRLPFGFPPKVWESILGQGAALTELVESGTLDDDTVEEVAASLRDLLRDYV
jgi:hypothetical protein